VYKLDSSWLIVRIDADFGSLARETMKHISFIAILMMGIQLMRGQSTIAYFNGPAFQLPPFEGYANGIDFDGDNAFDFTFSASGIICTMDIPSSGC
jgi:hypothetical protein